jgi:ubiquinone/menaquinone biosynthesis C-methylase UbiE
MLRVCERRHALRPLAPRLVLGDAHALPFPDHAFDRVFHVGALGSMRDARRALAEMARVARPGTPIVVVDEQLDPARDSSAYARLMFRVLTFYDPDPRCPTDSLPEGAVDVLEEQVSRFYYCLRFRMPPARDHAGAD